MWRMLWVLPVTQLSVQDLKFKSKKHKLCCSGYCDVHNMGGIQRAAWLG